MRAVAVVQPGKVEVVEIPEPTPGPYQVRIKTEVACLCNATDGKLVAGHFPGVEDYPLLLGHESAGIVDAVGEKVRNFHLGDRAIGGLLFDIGDPRYSSGWGGFCEYTIANDHDAMVADGVADEAHGWFEVHEIQRPVATDIPVEDAVMLCTWREVYGGFGDFHLQPGDHILVFGAGPVGLSFVKFGRLLGLDYIGVVDPLPDRLRPRLVRVEGVGGHPRRETRRGDRCGRQPGDRQRRLATYQDGRVGVRVRGDCRCGVLAGEGQGSLQFQPLHAPVAHAVAGKGRPGAALSAAEYITHDFPVEEVSEALAAIGRGEVIKAVLRY